VLDEVGDPEGRVRLVAHPDAEDQRRGRPLGASRGEHRDAVDLDALHPRMLLNRGSRAARHALSTARSGLVGRTGFARGRRPQPDRNRAQPTLNQHVVE
jgi:hypothetical protein